MKENESLESEIKRIAEIFIEKAKNKEIQIISHFDTDGITSAAIIIQTLKKLDFVFSLKIIKVLDEDFIKELKDRKLFLFLDLGSGSLNKIKEYGLKDVFIIDHHEINQEIPEDVKIINPQLHEKQKISSSGLSYLFSKEIVGENKKLVKLAIIGMIGDRLEKEIGKLNNEILNESDVKRKRGLLIYPATRPLNIVLEHSSSPYIPGISGNSKEVFELLKEANITPWNGKCKSLLELNEEEMEQLATAVMLRNPKAKNGEIIGDIFLIKMYNQLEDAREISAKINACSRSGESEIALQFCLETAKAKKKAQSIHSKYRQELLKGLKFAKEMEKFQGKRLVIINVKDNVKDTMIGTIASILSNSSIYEEETILTAMAYSEDKIKISARNVGNKGKNVREILNDIITKIGGEVGGHKFAAGGLIHKEKEKEFLESLKKNLEVEMIKV